MMVSGPVLAELEGVLSRPAFERKYGLTPTHTTALLRGLRRFAIVTPGEHKVSGVAPDPDDDVLLSCAMEGEADYLVTGDKGLLSLGSHEGIAIISPAAFVKAPTASWQRPTSGLRSGPGAGLPADPPALPAAGRPQPTGLRRGERG